MSAAENRLLAQLPVHERNAVFRGSQTVTCAEGDILLSAGTPSTYVFFPIDTVVAVSRTLLRDKSMDIGIVGSEGMLGVTVLGDPTTQYDDAIVRCAGTAWCIPADELRKQLHGRGLLQKHLARFTNAFLSQVSQTAVCGRFHSAAARLSRWLLMLHDRSPLPRISHAPALVASALGLESAEAEEALAVLSSSGAIRTRAHFIQVGNPEMLEATACECYETIRLAYERLRAA